MFWPSMAAGWHDRIETNMTGHIVCFGELLVRLSSPGAQFLMQSPVLDVAVGGAEANVAVGLAYLGHRASVVSCVPDNKIGRGARAAIMATGVNCDAVQLTPSGRMGLYFLEAGAGLRASQIVYDRAATSFSQCDPESFDWDAILNGASILHLSGITPALGNNSAHAAILAAKAARRLGVTVSFDGNYRAQLWEAWDSDPKTILNQLFSLADIAFANHRDFSLLLSGNFSGDGADRRREAVMAAFNAFPNLKLIASTARHLVDADHHRIAARVDTPTDFAQTDEIDVTNIVDRIGAGDAYAAGVLHSYFAKQSLTEMAQTGLALTALKHSVPGDASRIDAATLEAFRQGNLDVMR
jgi:2-dehydro-3-deoxygluconokinase